MKTRSIYILLIAAVHSGPFAGIFSPSGFTTDPTFFPIAVWLQSPSNANAYKTAGVNLYVGLWQGPTQQQLADLKTANMQVICDQNAYALGNLSAYGNTIAGWMHGDEPDNAQWNGSSYDPCISPDTIIKGYNGWKANDATRPVYLNLGQGVSYTTWVGRGTCTGHTEMYPRYLQGCDIPSYDIYPVNSSYSTVRNNLWYVPKGIDSLRIWSVDKKPVWCWIECTRIDSSSSAKPTPAQVKSEVWMALIHGARGFGYFCHSWYGGFREAAWLQDQPMRTMITNVNRRIDTLAPALNGPLIEGKVSVSSSNSTVPVDIMVKSYGGFTYIFAVAMRNDTTTAQFGISSLLEGTGVTVLDENRTIGIIIGNSTDRFSDHFNGYEVHLYKISTRTGAVARQGPGKQNRNMGPAQYDRAGAGQIYTLSGERSVSNASRGIFILRQGNGRVRKIAVLP